MLQAPLAILQVVEEETIHPMEVSRKKDGEFCSPFSFSDIIFTS